MKITNTLLIATVVGAAAMAGCAEIKDTGRTIGHGARDVAKTVGHASRDTVKAIGRNTKKVVNDLNDEEPQKTK